MSDLRIEGLWCYPIKSCRGVALTQALLAVDGFPHDRTWMVVDDNGIMITQRQEPRLALVDVQILATGLRLDAPEQSHCEVPWQVSLERRSVRCWDDRCQAWDCGDRPARWFSRLLGKPVRLVRFPEGHQRLATAPDSRDAVPAGGTRFTDGFPYLVVGSGSHADICRRSGQDLDMARFRPNVLISGAAPFAEDTWRRIAMGSAELALVKPCSRCAVTTVDQASAARGTEPLRTLAGYRRMQEGVFFGQNGLMTRSGHVAVGDPVRVVQSGPPRPGL